MNNLRYQTLKTVILVKESAYIFEGILILQNLVPVTVHCYVKHSKDMTSNSIWLASSSFDTFRTSTTGSMLTMIEFLQKYRMHRRHILPKDQDRRWQPHTDSTARGCIPRPILAYPPYHPNCGAPTNQIYPVWGHPNYRSHGVQMWGHAGYTAWHPPPQSWPWKTYPLVNDIATLPSHSLLSSITTDWVVYHHGFDFLV